jgi:hypothetical protein
LCRADLKRRFEKGGKKSCIRNGFMLKYCLAKMFEEGMDGFPSGQRGQTVNLLQIASVVRIHPHPFGILLK